MTRTALGRATLLLVAVHVLHDLDHVRQGTSAPGEVVGTAVAGWLATIVLVVLVARGHRLAPLYAAVFGITFALGFVAVHVLPHWSAFSASYAESGADALSWLLAFVPIAAGLYLSAEAVRALRTPATTVPA
jgi:hypothetical protein